MVDYLRVARAYLTGTTAAVWCFLFLCLLMISADVGELGRGQVGLLSGVLSKKSYLAMFAFFNACLLGVLLRDHIAHPWASLLPHYRRKHLLVTALIAVFFLAVPMFLMEFVGTSDVAPTSVAVIFLTCLAAGLWMLHHPALGVLAIPFLGFAMATSSTSPMLAAFLAGATPVASAALGFLSLVALGALAWRLLTMNEETFEYANARIWGDLLRGQGQAKVMANCLATWPAGQQGMLQNCDPLKHPFTNLTQVDKLSGYRERTLWQRLQLWRLGTGSMSPLASLGGQILISLTVVPLFVFTSLLVGMQNPARDVVLIMSAMIMTNPFNIWLFWFMRLNRLGYESLRPRTRQEFVREVGLALLWDNFQCWLGGVLYMGIAAAIWAPELLHVENLLLFISGTGVGQLCVYAMMGIWLLKLRSRGMVASISCAFCPFVAMVIWTMFTMNNRVSIGLNIAFASLLAVVGVATIALADCRWRHAELD